MTNILNNTILGEKVSFDKEQNKKETNIIKRYILFA